MIIKLLNVRLYNVMMTYLETLKDPLEFLITIKLDDDSFFFLSILHFSTY